MWSKGHSRPKYQVGILQSLLLTSSGKCFQNWNKVNKCMVPFWIPLFMRSNLFWLFLLWCQKKFALAKIQIPGQHREGPLVWIRYVSQWSRMITSSSRMRASRAARRLCRSCVDPMVTPRNLSHFVSIVSGQPMVSLLDLKKTSPPSSGQNLVHGGLGVPENWKDENG